MILFGFQGYKKTHTRLDLINDNILYKKKLLLKNTHFCISVIFNFAEFNCAYLNVGYIAFWFSNSSDKLFFTEFKGKWRLVLLLLYKLDFGCKKRSRMISQFRSTSKIRNIYCLLIFDEQLVYSLTINNSANSSYVDVCFWQVLHNKKIYILILICYNWLIVIWIIIQ